MLLLIIAIKKSLVNKERQVIVFTFGCCAQREGNVLAWFVSVSVSLAPPFFSLAAPPEGTRLACQLAAELAC